MKILVIGRGVPNEVYPVNGIFEFDQARALAKIDLDVTYFAIDLRSIRKKRKFGFESGITDNVHWYVLNIPIGALQKNVLEFFRTKALRVLYHKVFPDSKPDIIHAHFLGPAFSAAKLAEKEQIPLVITEHTSVMNTTEIDNHSLKMARYAYSKAKKLIAVGNRLAQNIQKSTGFQCSVIPNVMAESAFSEVVRVPHHDYYGYVFAGNLKPVKRPILLLEAFKEVLEHHPNIRLGIIGDGELREELGKVINDLGIQENVKVYGRLQRKQMAKEYSRYDCFVLPSASETFGVVYIEALSAGIPVIATACGGPEDFITADTGVIIPVDNKNALVKAMEGMLESSECFDSEKLRNYVQSHFSEEAVANELLHIYSDVLVKENKGRIV